MTTGGKRLVGYALLFVAAAIVVGFFIQQHLYDDRQEAYRHIEALERALGQDIVPGGAAVRDGEPSVARYGLAAVVAAVGASTALISATADRRKTAVAAPR